MIEAQRVAKFGVWRWRVGTQEFDWSDEIYRIAGRDPSTCIATLDNALSCIHPDDRERTLERLHAVVTSGQQLKWEFRLVRPTGEVRYCMAEAGPVVGPDAHITMARGFCQDITERKEIEERLRDRERQLARLVSNLPGVVCRRLAKLPWRFLSVGEGIAALTGYRATEFFAEIEWSDIVHPDDIAMLEREIAQSLRERRTFSSVYRIINQTAGVRWLREQGQGIYDEAGEPLFVESFISDVTEQKTSEERVRWAADHDRLTALPNRVHFQRVLEQLLAQAANATSRVGLLLIGVDGLKGVNDKFGHDVGDALLKAVADRLRSQARASDFVARLGSDEFAVILRDRPDERSIVDDGEAMLLQLGEPMHVDEHRLECRVSIGAAIHPEHGWTAQEFLKHADIALHSAKSFARGQLVTFRSEMRAAMQKQSSMLAQARAAVEAGRIFAFYQPKVDLGSNELVGFEALLRWHHPRMGLQLPGTIAAAFDDPELAAALTDSILGRVLRDMSEWLDAGIDFGHVAINASSGDFKRPGFAEKILEQLRSSGLSSHCLEVEVTESVLLGEGSDEVERALQLLCAAGVKIALDDFGTGYASLSHLKQFPVDIIKIDQSFVRDLEQDPDDAAIVRAVVNLGQSLGITIVAEGIETSGQAAFLADEGCDIGQGYLFGKAMPAKRVPKLVLSWTGQAGSRGPPVWLSS